MSFRWTLEAQVTDGTTHWSDLTNRVREIRSNRGYDSDEDEAAAGTLRAVLNNEDAALTPGNSQSPYTGVDLEEGVRASVVLTYDGSPHSAQIPVGSSATRLVGTTDISTGPYRVQATVTNDSTVDAYLGSSDVTTGSGFELSTGDTVELDLDAGDVLWGVTGSSGSVDVLAAAQPTTFRRFTGEAKAWIPRFTADHDEVVVLDAVDGFEHLSRFDLDYAHRNEVLDLDPVGYWPLGEDGEFTSRAKDLSGDRHEADYHGKFTLGHSAIVKGSGGGPLFEMLSTDFPGRGHVSYPTDAFNQVLDSSGQSMALSFWVSGLDLSGSDSLFFAGPPRHGPKFADDAADVSVVCNLRVQGGELQLLFGRSTDEATSELFASTDADLSTGVNHIVVARDDSTAKSVTMWLDGSQVHSSTYNSTPLRAGKNTQYIAPLQVPHTTEGSTAMGLVMSDMAVLDFMPSSSQVSALHQSGNDAYASELPGPRINRVLDWQGWPSTSRDISTGDTPLAGLTQVDTVLNQSQDAAFADDGVFFISREGDAAFQGRRDRWTRHQLTDTGRIATFSDTGQPGYVSFSLNYDTVRLVDRTEVSGTNVGTAAYNSSSTRYPDRTANISSLSNNEADIASRAEWHTNRWDSVNLRPDGVNISTVTTGQEVACAQTDVAHTVRLRRNKPGADAVSQDMRVTGLRERVTEGGLQWSWEADTLDATDDQPLILDSTEEFSALGTGTLAY